MVRSIYKNRPNETTNLSFHVFFYMRHDTSDFIKSTLHCGVEVERNTAIDDGKVCVCVCVWHITAMILE